jgi:uncharacterized protein DUF1592/uncharacterized protein DUF1588/uncharacterized protein DUF1585/uncharacterized protein DUF1587/uncharacterized protein DUF1595/cytochrome c
MSINSSTSAPASPPRTQIRQESRSRFASVLFLSAWFLLITNEAGFSALTAQEDVNARQRTEFIGKYCSDCHDDVTKKSDLDLVHHSFDLRNANDFDLWVKVHDRVQAGEMPPKKKPRPAAADLETFVNGLTAQLTATEQVFIQTNGRAMKRRLNRYEYENTVRDLLSLPWIQIKDRLPEDGEKYRFNKIGEALDVSYVQLSRYMNSADYAIKQAMSAELEHPNTVTNRYYARNEFGLTNFRPRENGTLPDRLSFPVLDSHAQPEVRAGRAPLSTPETRDREAVGKVSSIFSDAGGYSWSQFRAPVAGRYRLRFKGYTIWVSGGGIGRWFYEGFGQEKSAYFYLPLWHRPNLDEVWPGRGDEPMGVYASSAGQNRKIAAFDFKPEPTVHEVEVRLAPGDVIRTDGMNLFRTRVNGSDEQYVNPRATPEGIPGYAIQWMEVEGPLYDETQGAGYRRLFGDLPLKRSAEGEAGVGVDVVPPPAPPGQGGPGGFGGPGGGRGAGGGRGFRGGGRGGGLRQVNVEVVSQNPQQDAERLLRSFVQRAYRQPVTDEETAVFIDLFKDQYAKGFGFAKSMLAAYTAVLSSPGFLYVEEKPGRLDDYALASRLSYFLWNSEPDDALRKLAANGELHRPEVLKAQTERLIDDAKFRRFVDAFADYWLDLRKIDDTSPSSTLYNDYELDDWLKLSSVEETQLFVEELFRGDLPARNVVNSDFAFLNERLAKLYGVPGVTGVEMRRVTLPKDSLRGGLMTQASVLRVTANGTTTSPVLRGHWITERILGMETPPPPKVPSIEPDIRGAVTIRQQLEKHRADPSCATCHTKMDPPGLALESFDVVGGWRDRYRAAKEGATNAPGSGLDGQRFAFYYALPVDCTGNLPDGRPFRDVRELKTKLLDDPAPIARNIARQLAVYATGAPVRFSDREQIEKILQRTKAKDYGVRSMVRELVQSDLFQMK